MITNAFIISSVVLFIHVCLWEQMILEKPGIFMRNKLPVYIAKPLFDCVVCMTPWWGSLIIFLFDLHTTLKVDVLTIAAAGGMSCVNMILTKWYEILLLEEENKEMGYDEKN